MAEPALALVGWVVKTSWAAAPAADVERAAGRGSVRGAAGRAERVAGGRGVDREVVEGPTPELAVWVSVPQRVPPPGLLPIATVTVVELSAVTTLPSES